MTFYPLLSEAHLKPFRLALVSLLTMAVSAEAQRPARPSRPAQDIDPWRVETSRSEMTDQVTVILTLNAANTVPGAIFDFRPQLYVRCHEEKLDVFITTGAVLDQDDAAARAGFENAPDITPVRVRWGNDAPIEERWLRSTDYTAAFAPDPSLFLYKLVVVPSLRLEYHPFDAAPRVAVFNARGLDRHMAALEAACAKLGTSSVTDTDTDTADSSPPQQNQVLSIDVVQEKPEPLSHPAVVYPPLLQQAGIEGRVVVQAIIDTTGRVEPNSVRIIESSNPGFDQPAKNVVLKSLYRPGRVYGRAVRVLVRIPIDFKIQRNR